MKSVARLQIDRAEGMQDSTPRIWGLGPMELHDAYWRSLGIQCVRRSEHFEPQSGKDLYMLMEPDQCAVFDIRKLANSIAWNRAPLSRIRITTSSQPYVEHVIENGRGELVKIEREYGSADEGSCRVLLTRRASIAQIWANSNNRRSAWTELRRFIDWTRTDHYRIEGVASRCETPLSSRTLIEKLVEEWSEPNLAIEPLVEFSSGIWGLRGSRLEGMDHIVAPAWIGDQGDSEHSGILVGPVALPDDPNVARGEESVRVLDISEIRRSSTRDEYQDLKDEISPYQILKRTMDLVVSACFLLLMSIPMLVIAIIILTKEGRPVFFPHIRQTRGGRNFKCWKFRTMMRDAEQMVGDLSEENLADGPQVYIKNDPRITPLGSFLRKYHLDELPQFWNVLKGDMSLVGPRPSPDNENQFCPAWREARLSVRPGITGLWQVSGRSDLGFKEMVQLDIFYIQNWSPWLDLKILISTLPAVLRGRGAS